jgi:hypothetical protein
MDISKFSPEARLILRLGHKYSQSNILHTSLQGLVNATYQQYNSRIQRLSPVERAQWQNWYNDMHLAIRRLPADPPRYIDSRIRKGVRDLKALPVVLKLADKNLGMVPIHETLYDRLVWDNLKPPTFVQVSSYPHADIIRRLTNILKTSQCIPKGLCERWMKHSLDHGTPCPFYIIPKLHKATLGTRPITAQHSSPLAPWSKILADILQREVTKFPEIAKDSKTVMQQLDTHQFTAPFVFMTYDVVALYPSINLQDAILTLHKNVDIMRKDNGFWTKLLKLIMFNNYVTANGNIYRQMVGTATGTQVAPPFANLYMYHKYKSILSDPRILYQSRFIDDGCLIVTTGLAAVEIADRLNSFGNLKFTFAISKKDAIYLDMQLFKGQRYTLTQRLDSKVYFKPTNKMLYLPAISNHPGAHKLCVVRGEAIRCLRNTTSKTDWLHAMHLIFKGLKARGYRPTVLQQKFKSIKFEDRAQYLHTEGERTKPQHKLVLARYHPHTRYHWRRLLLQYPLSKVIVHRRLGMPTCLQREIQDSWPPQVVFHDFSTLGKRVISAKRHSSNSAHEDNSLSPAR